MGCACKVNRQIDYIHKKYGDKVPQSKGTDIAGKVSVMLKNLILWVLCLPVVPFMLVYIIYMKITDKTIHIGSFVRTRKQLA